MMMEPEAEAGKKIWFESFLIRSQNLSFFLLSKSVYFVLLKNDKSRKNNECLISIWDEQDAMDQAEAAEIEELEVAEDIMVNEAIVRIWKN